MSESTGIRISELEAADGVGLSDLFIVSQFNGSDLPDNEKYVSKKVTSDILANHLLGRYSDEIEQKITEEIGRLGDLGNVVEDVHTISSDLGFAISAILGLDACRRKFKSETTQNIQDLSNGIEQARTDLSNTIDAVSTYLSTETTKTIENVSTDILNTMSEVSGTTMTTINDVSVTLSNNTNTLVDDVSTYLSDELTKTIGQTSVDCLSITQLCVDTVSADLREGIDNNKQFIDRLRTLSMYYDNEENNIILKETTNFPDIDLKLNRDDIFMDLLSDLTLDSMISDVKCDRKNLSVWFNVGNPPKKTPIVFPLSTFHHNYIFDKPNSGLSVNHPISGNISVGVDFGQVSNVMSQTFYTKAYILRNYYTKTTTNNLLKDLSTDVLSASKEYTDYNVENVINYTNTLVQDKFEYVNDRIVGIENEISDAVSAGDNSTLLSAKAYTDEVASRLSNELTSTVVVSGLSSQTWYLYTDNDPNTPIPFNIVLSVGDNQS